MPPDPRTRIPVSPERMLDSIAFVEWLRQSINEKPFPSNGRTRSSGSCFAIAQQHHHAIVLLIEHELFASSFSLLRVEFEAYVRGQWLLVCATDDEVEKYLRGWEPPKFAILVESLEKTPGFKDGDLSRIKRDGWKTMCAFTHTGGLHVQRWNTSDAIEANYTEPEILEVLALAEIVGAMSVLGIAELANDIELARLVSEKVAKRAEK